MDKTDEISSIKAIKHDVEGMVLRNTPDGRAVVDEVSEGPDGLVVYVSGDAINHNSPPRKLNEKMLEHGFAYNDWIVNGMMGDKRAMFNYTEIK